MDLQVCRCHIICGGLGHSLCTSRNYEGFSMTTVINNGTVVTGDLTCAADVGIDEKPN